MTEVSSVSGPPSPPRPSESGVSHASPPSMWWWIVPLGAWLVGVMALSIPDHVQAGDAGEFATIMLEGGVPHPSGYPWMRMLGVPARMLAALGMTPMHAAAWPCAAAGLAAWLVLWPRLAQWAGRGSATVAVLVCATASPMIVHVADSEVWGLHLLASAIVIRMATAENPRAWRLGLVFGLAISHHLSAALLLPLVVGAVWPRPWRWRALIASAVQGIGGGLLGLLPYATLAIGGGGSWRWGDTTSLSGLLHHVLRADYGIFALSLHTENPPMLDQWARAINTVGNAAGGGLPPGPIAAAITLVLIAALALRRPESARVGPWWGLWVTIAGCTLAFPASHNIDPTSVFGAWILERFDLLTILLWSIPWALAAARIMAWAQARVARVAVGLGAVAMLLVQPLRTVARGVPSADDGVERYAVDLLQTPDPDTFAIVVGTDDHRMFPILFAQHVLHRGDNVLYIDASLLSHVWYREHLRRRWPQLPDVDKPVALMGALWRDPQLRDTPIYLANIFSRPSAGLPMVPQGVLWRVLPPHGLHVEPAQIVDDHLAALRRYGDIPPHTPTAAHPWTDDLRAAYTVGTRRLLTALNAEGREALARRVLDALPARGPSPTHP